MALLLSAGSWGSRRGRIRQSSMRIIRIRRAKSPAVPLCALTSTIAWVLITLCLIYEGYGRASAVADITACRFYAFRCGSGGANTPFCTLLRQRCEKEFNPVDPMEMPYCGKDEEIVIVPTCQCRVAGDADATVGNNEGCTSCTTDGIRLECQKSH
jgi:hypothetical protein